MRLQREEDRCQARDAEVERLRSEAAELTSDMSACRQKEADLLQFTQKLTDKNVTLQSDLAAAEARASTLESEHGRLAAAVAELEAHGGQTGVELEEERKRRKAETEMLAKKLAEKSKQVNRVERNSVDVCLILSP